ncbi:MAG: DUF6290 family protein [Bifidobacteriaceae bacterium]|nr:DUF6290 family protein [Bifidobacteriaceae bacterium]
MASVRHPVQEGPIPGQYAALHGISIADFARSSLMERIEDEFDLRELEAAIAASDGESISHEELMHKYDLR